MAKKTYLTVTAINKYLEKKYVNDPYLKEVYLKGEVSNLKLHTSGNLYFSLKDENTKINALKFNAHELTNLKDGDNVFVTAQINFYFPYGEHRLIVSEIKQDSVGDLYRKFIELRDKLHLEGLFDNKHKKSISRINMNIAIITSETGAAIEDMRKTLLRRNPIAKITLYPSLVQGESSINDLVKNLKIADANGHDVILLARGGGSIEDLWSFNSETVVRTIFSCKTPVVTGIGHEPDVTLSDYVADLRASTPTAAAEEVTKLDINTLKNLFSKNTDTLNRCITEIIKANKQKLINLENNYYIKNFDKRYDPHRVYLENNKEKLSILINNLVIQKKTLLNNNKEKLFNIDLLHSYKFSFEKIVEKLSDNSPLKILQKGYSIVEDSNNRKISSIDDVIPNDNINIVLKDGNIKAKVIEITKERI